MNVFFVLINGTIIFEGTDEACYEYAVDKIESEGLQYEIVEALAS